MENKNLEFSGINSNGQNKSVENLYVENSPEQEWDGVLDNDIFIRHVLLKNPEKGFEMIFKANYTSLCNLAVRYVYSKDVAEDIVSEVFFDFWKNKRFEKVSCTFRTYLFQSVRYQVFHYLKREFSRKSEPLNYTDTSFDFHVENFTPQEIMLFDELNFKITETVNSFSPQCLNVFLLSRFEGKKNREIAENLGIKLKTVESHIKKALSTLKGSLENYLK